MANSNKISIGNCGEYYVAAELERRGFSVAVPMSNTELFDILAFNRKSHKQWAIQVKTTVGKASRWTLNKKNELITDDNVVYVFVKIRDKEMPTYHIVPSKEVVEQIKERHQKWLYTPGIKGQDHQDNNIRTYIDENDAHQGKWSYLEADDD